MMFQACHQALQLSVSMWLCIWDPNWKETGIGFGRLAVHCLQALSTNCCSAASSWILTTKSRSFASPSHLECNIVLQFTVDPAAVMCLDSLGTSVLQHDCFRLTALVAASLFVHAFIMHATIWNIAWEVTIACEAILLIWQCMMHSIWHMHVCMLMPAVHAHIHYATSCAVETRKDGCYRRFVRAPSNICQNLTLLTPPVVSCSTVGRRVHMITYLSTFATSTDCTDCPVCFTKITMNCFWLHALNTVLVHFMMHILLQTLACASARVWQPCWAPVSDSAKPCASHV